MDDRKPRITFVIGSLRCGGAERSMTNLANALSAKGYCVSIVTFRHEMESDFYKLNKQVNRYHCNLGFVRFYNPILLVDFFVKLRNAIVKTQPDVVISFLNLVNCFVLPSMCFTKIPVIVSERSDQRIEKINYKFHLLRVMFYPLAASVVIQYNDLMKWVNQFYPRWKVNVIPNMVNPIAHSGNTSPPKDFISQYRLITIGRLGREKRYDRLIALFAGISSRHPNWHLYIIGEGDMREALTNQIRDLGLHSKVHLLGQKNNIQNYYLNATLFALTSDYEGFPMVVAEAMAHGLPVIAFGCPSAIPEMVRDGLDGFVVPPDRDDLFVQRLSTLMDDAELRNNMGERAREIVERYSIDSITNQWETLIAEVLNRRVK